MLFQWPGQMDFQRLCQTQFQPEAVKATVQHIQIMIPLSGSNIELNNSVLTILSITQYSPLFSTCFLVEKRMKNDEPLFVRSPCDVLCFLAFASAFASPGCRGAKSVTS